MLDFRKAMRTFVRFFALLAALSSLSLHAQVDTGTISGAVRDPSGAVITDATITVTNTADGYVSTATTNHDGLYTVVDLRPGNYRVSAAAAGFQSVTRAGIDLRLQDRLAVNFDLAVGQTATQIEVQSEGTALETETTSIGQVIEQTAIQSLPLNGRNYIQLAILGAGTTPSQRSNERNSFVANGQREIQNSYVLDGIDNKNKIVGFDSSDAQSIEPIIDAIQEFKVQTATFSAEFGQSAGGVSTSPSAPEPISFTAAGSNTFATPGSTRTPTSSLRSPPSRNSSKISTEPQLVAPFCATGLSSSSPGRAPASAMPLRSSRWCPLLRSLQETSAPPFTIRPPLNSVQLGPATFVPSSQITGFLHRVLIQWPQS
jgi:Carboxypeptidase regulatory-like domain